MAPGMTLLGSRDEGVHVPGVGLRPGPGREHRLDVDAGELLEVVHAAARTLDLAAGGGRHPQPMAVLAGKVLDRVVDIAVLLDWKSTRMTSRQSRVFRLPSSC